MKGLCSVLYQALVSIRPFNLKLEPMHLISCRSGEAVLGDDVTEHIIYRTLVGEEKAARHFENRAKLKAMREGRGGREKD